MIALFWLLLALSVSPFKSKNGLAAENAALRHQLIVLQRRVRGRVQLTNGDRLFLVTLYRWFPSVLRAITIVRPETLVRWHRAGLPPKRTSDLRVNEYTHHLGGTWKFHLTPVLYWMGRTHSPRFNMSGSLAMFDATRLASSIFICFASMASASVERP